MLKLTASAGRFVSLLKRGQRWQLQQSQVGLAGDHHFQRRPRDRLNVQRAAPPAPLQVCPVSPVHRHHRTSSSSSVRSPRFAGGNAGLHEGGWGVGWRT